MTQRLAVIAYPILADVDRARIQAIRIQHDPQFTLLDPHFTVVFPIKVLLVDLIGQVEAAARATLAFPFTLHSVRAVRDAFGAGGHVCLIPERGGAEVVALHESLYSGALRWAHRPEIPYLPHITVGACSNFDRCEALVHELARSPIDMPGRIETVNVVEIAAKVTTVATFHLGSPPGPIA